MAAESAVFAALADPTRRQLLLHLAEQSPRTASQLAGAFPISRQGLLKHLNVLEAAGLVVAHRAGREKRYAPALGPLRELERYVEQLTAAWDARLARLKAYVEEEA